MKRIDSNDENREEELESKDVNTVPFPPIRKGEYQNYCVINVKNLCVASTRLIFV